MIKVVIVGGGWSGCAAALAAAKTGAQVLLVERTDLLLGTGLVGGIFRNNGRYTAAEEAIAMGGGDLFAAMDDNCRHSRIMFPGHHHASLYNVTTMEPKIKAVLESYGVELRTRSRVVDVRKFGRTLQAVLLNNGEFIKADAFVDATGTAGPMGQCLTYGNGCAMCILRCPSFGPRISIAAKADVEEVYGQKADGSLGAMSGSCKINKDSLSVELRQKLETEGIVILPIPERLRKGRSMLTKKACSQYALPEYAENIILLDTGHAKLMTSYFPLDELRTIPGLEAARYEDPYAGGIGNSVRYLGSAVCDASLKAAGIDNLFCAGEKSMILVGHTEAIVTGLLAGHNAVRCVLDMNYLELPKTTLAGDFISFIQDAMKSEEGRRLRYTFSGGMYFAHMQEQGLYSIRSEEIAERVELAGMSDVYNQGLV